MKKSLLFVSALMLGTASGFAQLDVLPNAQFDTWVSGEPSGWGTTNTLAVPTAVMTGTAAQATGADMVGANTLVLTSVAANPAIVPGGVVPGAAYSGASVAIVNNLPKISGGTPFRNRPVALKVLCKYAGQGADMANIGVFLKKTVTYTTTPTTSATFTVGFGGLPVATAATYAWVTVPINYNTVTLAPGGIASVAVAPDSVIVVLASSGQSGGVVGSKFYVDSVKFDYGCDLDPLITTTGTAPAQLPSTTDTLKLTAGASYSKTWTIFIPKNVTSPVPADLDSVKISPTQVTSTGLGASATYTVTCNWPNFMFGVNTVGCITVSGTVPATPVNGMGSVTITPKVFGPGVLAAFPAGFDAPAQKTIVKIGTGTGIATFDDKNGFSLSQNNPNPFDGSTTINFTCPVSGKVDFTVVDVLGRQVYDTNINASAGENTFTFTTDLANGTYFFSVSDGTNTITKKMVITE